MTARRSLSRAAGTHGRKARQGTVWRWERPSARQPRGAKGRRVAAGGGRGPAGPAGEGGGEAGRARRGEVAVRVLPAERGHADGTQVPVVTAVAPSQPPGGTPGPRPWLVPRPLQPRGRESLHAPALGQAGRQHRLQPRRPGGSVQSEVGGGHRALQDKETGRGRVTACHPPAGPTAPGFPGRGPCRTRGHRGQRAQGQGWHAGPHR